MNWKLLTPDSKLLFVTRAARLFAYGFLSVVLVLYLSEMGYQEAQIGLLLTLTLLGDTAISASGSPSQPTASGANACSSWEPG